MPILKKLIVPLTLIVLLAVLGFSLSQKPSAPDVTFTTLQGEKISMASLKGKVVLVNFWATDCPGCIKEMPDLMNTYTQYKPKGFEVIAVAMPYDPPAQVLNYSQQKALPFPVMHDGLSEMVQAFGGVNLTPTTYLYDKQGHRLQRIIGELDFVQLRQLLDSELQ
ncbi:MAG: thioredoxin [Methylophilaceae bacterium 17-44-8]|nr:MAG: thioredoxin [Methylophilales bacterium 16-45-7]OZA06141.1 MAG: thioredoxin [Methylophilaceae bacterium 17-44-8]